MKIACPKCKSPESLVLESRGNQAGEFIRRRRECEKCQHRWSTYETSEADLSPVTQLEIADLLKSITGLRDHLTQLETKVLIIQKANE